MAEREYPRPEVVFIGRDGSMGFKKNKVYKIKSIIKNNYIYLKVFDDNSSDSTLIPYSSLEAVLKNWKIL